MLNTNNVFHTIPGYCIFISAVCGARQWAYYNYRPYYLLEVCSTCKFRLSSDLTLKDKERKDDNV